ncbi:stage II sporulation protein M [Candidatus Woesearchaeota archaeon]|nr:stage II sporulation protein M [Candidatus Woesearchaeota archaeon]MBW3013841.1 stage II sporulation protein M [Candidatus Woesearchaeota archaeon]
MVLESLLDYEKIKKRPFLVFLMGFIYASIAIIIGLVLFKNNASLVIVFFTAFAAFHFMYVSIKTEELNDLLINNEFNLLKEHGKTIALFVFLFLGFFAAFTLWALLLPENLANTLFSTQYDTISNLNAAVASGSAIYPKYITSIFFNNVKVLIFCILFSFLYGAGAIFILVWNASVGGAFIGSFIRTKLLSYTSIHAVGLGFVRYMPHGVLEMAAYFVGALAGGIISVAVIKHDFGSKKFFKIIFDSSELIMIALLMLFLATLVEVFITPSLVTLLG